MLGALLEACRDDTRLCVAADLTLPSETITLRTIAAWRRAPLAVGKRPAVFLLLANSG
jgi:16S rRNA (cytidine1402-2'-O)-methyltransferase